ncbi:MAG: deoxyribose-phosphate aldolase [Cutibacterium avidum]|nr:deoxyribose-phosphate aldolase [Cutibacterium avidum]MBS6260552.1 deoxyribose-phosphate aldolase [Propionibacterium sp.]MCO6662157.1 deoxyribose-phosphate aldolase [Cutibacterium avidum]MCO6666631.1 deoxyribose-phosphate aldolase [Cutibacterium avidum]MCO6682037.1 deoxyribose-phosphate aldolase [Cutibacterium avidum]MCO6685137.1 deoxyribose-phosphate aldolase [Cutibacterium avidum]
MADGTSKGAVGLSSISDLVDIRSHEPQRVREALATRPRRAMPTSDEKLMIIACDHPARGALGAGADELAMADRGELLARCVEALGRPGVTGFLGTADMIEDLTLLGALDGKLVYGSMNRGGLLGAKFEMDDRFTGYDAQGIADSGLDGGKILLRINYDDPGSVATLEACAHAVDELADHQVMAMIEPFISQWQEGRIRNDLSPQAVIKAIAIASGLGRTSAHTWLKLPAVDDMERVMASTTMPALILGGEVNKDADAALGSWQRALAIPNVRGLVIGRSLLFPPSGDVAAVVDEAVGLL